MSYSTAKKHERARKQRRALAREQEKLERQRRAARRKRRRVVLGVGLPLAAVATAAGVVLTVRSRAEAAEAAERAAIRAAAVGPQNMLSDGIVLAGDGTTMAAVPTAAIDADAAPVATTVDRTSGVLDIVMYADYRSADAATFWTAVSTDLESWVTGGQATLELHPLALDGDDYALRAAGAMGCVADTTPDSAFVAHAALLAAQPDLDEDGLDTAGLETLLSGVGVDTSLVSDCLEQGDFADWASEATARAAASVPYDQVGQVTTSPVVLVAGVPYTGDLADADAFAAFVSQVYSDLSTGG
ncbi:DsbA family protein [Cellulomonas soli]|uniref:DsbA family protein n=1 Tax=Cellulomonas soli TaxID=931535 RepID=UPI003F82CA8C